MKWTLLLFCAFFLSASTSAQLTDDEAKKLSSRAWKLMDLGKLDSALIIADKLEETFQANGNVFAHLNSLQIRGERYYWTGQHDSVLYWYEKALKAADHFKNWDEKAYCQVSLGSVHTQLGRTDEALEYFDKALKYRLEEQDTSNIMHLYIKKAWVNVNIDRMDEAMANCLSGLKMAEEQQASSFLGDFYTCMGVILEKQEDLDQALEYALKAILAYEESGDFLAAANAKIGIAIIYKNQKRFEEARAIYLDLLPFYQEVDFPMGRMSVLANKTVLENRDGNHELALEHGVEALQLTEDYGFVESQSDMLNEIGIAHLRLGNPKEALTWSKAAIEILEGTTFIEKRKDAEKTLSEIYTKLGFHEEALSHFETYALLKDSIFQKDRSNQMLRLEEQYKSEKQAKEIVLLNAQNELAETKRKGLIAGLIGVLVLSGVIINREIQRRKKTKELFVSELKLSQSEASRLQDQLEFKNKELTAQALHIAQKNEMLNAIKSELEELRKKEETPHLGGVLSKINLDAQIDRNWDQFIQLFTDTNQDFLQTVSTRYPTITKNELRLCALLKMNLTSKDIGTILNISDDGVKKARYRLRKKMQLETNDSLEAVIVNI